MTAPGGGGEAIRSTGFDVEADEVRSGWQREEQLQGIELWSRKASGRTAWVLGLPHDGVPGYWQFVVCDEGGALLTKGESTRRGWAMDGADAAMAVAVH